MEKCQGNSALQRYAYGVERSVLNIGSAARIIGLSLKHLAQCILRTVVLK